VVNREGVAGDPPEEAPSRASPLRLPPRRSASRRRQEGLRVGCRGPRPRRPGRGPPPHSGAVGCAEGDHGGFVGAEEQRWRAAACPSPRAGI